MARKANRKTTRDARGLVLIFEPHEFRRLKHNTPGPSGRMGGYQNLENLIKERTDPATLRCPLTPVEESMLIDYINKYGDGGPNRRIRASCIPALRRIGIELLPEFVNR